MNILPNLKIQKAKNFTKSLHKDHKRMSGEPVWEHTFRVFNILNDIGVTDENILIASLLHQSLTFSDEIKPEIKKNFGPKVLEIVESYHHLANVPIKLHGNASQIKSFSISTASSIIFFIV